MKKLLKVLGRIVVCVALLLVVALGVFRITGLNPQGRKIPGLWLSGHLLTTPVTDWSFTDQVQTVQIQTKAWYLLPHSVNINCVAYQGKLYLDSFYGPGLTYPHGRSWNEDVARDPHVRIKIGNQLYDRTLALVTDPAEQEAVNAAKSRKYPELKLRPGGTIVLFRVLDH